MLSGETRFQFFQLFISVIAKRFPSIAKAFSFSLRTFSVYRRPSLSSPLSLSSSYVSVRLSEDGVTVCVTSRGKMLLPFLRGSE